MPCSAIKGEGINDGIEWILEDITSRISMLD